MTDPSDRCRVFRQLHQSDCFVIPNPWDLGSARVLTQLGFRALATTSSGHAWSLGKPDNAVSLDEALAQLRSITRAVAVPVNADFEGGFATAPEAVAANVAAATATGIAGLSIEDSTSDLSHPLLDLTLASERCSMRVRATIEITTAELSNGTTEPTHVNGSLVSVAAPDAMQAEFALTGCHTQNVSGP